MRQRGEAGLEVVEEGVGLWSSRLGCMAAMMQDSRKCRCPVKVGTSFRTVAGLPEREEASKETEGVPAG